MYVILGETDYLLQIFLNVQVVSTLLHFFKRNTLNILAFLKFIVHKLYNDDFNIKCAIVKLFDIKVNLKKMRQ